MIDFVHKLFFGTSVDKKTKPGYTVNNTVKKKVAVMSTTQTDRTNQDSKVNTLDHRPINFDQVIGQEEVKEYLKIKISAFKKTRNSVVHMLFLGFSGSGKTTMANVVANEMGVTFHQIMGTRIKTFSDLYNIIRNVEENDVVFIDEIHAIAPKVQEQLYGVMEDFEFTLEDKNLNRTRVVKMPKFTMIGATTHSGNLTGPLLSRFQYKAQLLPYNVQELTEMVKTAGKRIYKLNIPDEVAVCIAKLSKKTARVCYNILRNYMDLVEAECSGRVNSEMLTIELLYKTLKHEHIDPMIGLDYASRKYLVALLREGKPCGSRSLGSMINEQESTILGMIEPFLLSDITLEFKDNGSLTSHTAPFIRITPKGRVATANAYKYIKLCTSLQQIGWLSNESLSVKPE
jgi:Holliday junction DNA helicase RuvB